MSTHSWLSAKSQKSIPVPEVAPSPMRDCCVDLFVSSGLRITGHLTGYGVLSVERVINMNGTPELLPYEINVVEFVASQEGVDIETAFERVKLIRHDELASTDCYTNLPFSMPCPYQGIDYPPAVKADHLYDGDYFKAWVDEFGSLNVNNTVRADEVKQTVMDFLENHVSSSEIGQLIAGDCTMGDVMENNSHCPMINVRSAEYAFLMLLQDEHSELQISELADSAGPKL